MDERWVESQLDRGGSEYREDDSEEIETASVGDDGSLSSCGRDPLCYLCGTPGVDLVYGPGDHLYHEPCSAGIRNYVLMLNPSERTQ